MSWGGEWRRGGECKREAASLSFSLGIVQTQPPPTPPCWIDHRQGVAKGGGVRGGRYSSVDGYGGERLRRAAYFGLGEDGRAGGLPRAPQNENELLQWVGLCTPVVFAAAFPSLLLTCAMK